MVSACADEGALIGSSTASPGYYVQKLAQRKYYLLMRPLAGWHGSRRTRDYLSIGCPWTSAKCSYWANMSKRFMRDGAKGPADPNVRVCMCISDHCHSLFAVHDNCMFHSVSYQVRPNYCTVTRSGVDWKKIPDCNRLVEAQVATRDDLVLGVLRSRPSRPRAFVVSHPWGIRV
jgi:hypothetical protein